MTWMVTFPRQADICVLQQRCNAASFNTRRRCILPTIWGWSALLIFRSLLRNFLPGQFLRDTMKCHGLENLCDVKHFIDMGRQRRRGYRGLIKDRKSVV